ncbi:hypothetical protein V1511DRAFT_454886 [Dipodascopsis uninucleata]
MPVTAQEEVEVLSKEVATLSTKLILAVERQADLEDNLAATRHELDVAHAHIRELEATQKKHMEMLEKGLLVDKKEVEIETTALMNKLMEESKARLRAEKDRRSIEQEVEDLTRSLFEEANKMVSVARKENNDLEHRNKQLENLIAEKDNLLVSLQEQLIALKKVLQEVTDEQEAVRTHSLSSLPSSNRSSIERESEEKESHTTEEDVQYSNSKSSQI